MRNCSAFFVLVPSKMMQKEAPILVTCFPKVAGILAEEIEDLGYEVVSKDRTGVRLHGEWRDIMTLNLHLRTANRVLWEIASFKAANPDQLYDQVKQIKWHLLIKKTGYFTVQSYVKNDFIRDTRFANLRLKDAIADYYQETMGVRPDSGPDIDKTVIYLYWVNDDVTLYFDTSGESISKHGYRKNPWKAPMMESLAAATIHTSNWDQESDHFVNPMCGSGTLVIEAALMASGMPGSWHRNNFGFMHILGYDPNLWVTVRRGAKKDFTTPTQKFVASDINPRAVEIAKENAREAGVEELIDFQVCDFAETTVPKGKGVVFLNPEYGERLGDEKKLNHTYKKIGDFFKKKCAGYTGYVFTGNLNLAKAIGLKPTRKYEFLNARIDSRLIQFDLYAGKKN